MLRYLQATKSLKFVHPRDSDYNLIGESDADWSGDHEDRRSTTGYSFKLRFSGGAVSWQTKKQRTVALSSCEAEFQSLAAAVQEATFLRSLMCEMAYQQMQATVIGEDNQSCIKLATNPVMHKRTKHIDTKHHFIREKVDDNSVQLVFTPTDQLAADLLTNSLPQVKVEQHRIGSIADSSSRQRNNLSGGVEEQNLVKFLELQNLNLYILYIIIAQNRETH